MRKNVSNSPRLLELKKHRLRILLSKVFLFLFVFGVILGCLAYLSRLKQLNIDEMEVRGNRIVSTEEIESVPREQTAGYYLWFFPKTNIFVYPKNTIAEELKKKFKRLKDVNFSIKDNKILEISVTERETKYLWCEGGLQKDVTSTSKNDVSLSQEKQCYFVDDDGFVFDEAPYFSGAVYFKFYGKNFSSFNFTKLLAYKQAFESAGLKPVSLYIEDNGDVRVFLSAKKSSDLGPEIIFKADAELQKVIDHLDTALKTEPLLSDFKNKYSSLLYIDLRFGNKVYYKFRH